MGERLHRALLAVVFLIALSCLFLTYVAIDRYIESGRSFYGDRKTSIGYQWKGESCDRLFQDISPSPEPLSFRAPSSEFCAIARRHHVPPLALKAILEEARSAHRDSPSPAGSDLDSSLAILADARANLIGQLPGLEQRYGRLQREVLCMWLFFPGVVGAIISYFYARRCTPLLFAVIKRRFDTIMFGRNRYSDGWDNFFKQWKK